MDQKFPTGTSLLPEADPALRAWFLDWLDRVSAHVRDVDYGAVRPLVHPDALAFTKQNDVISGLEAWIRTEWDETWPRTSGFRFLPERAEVLASADGTLAVVVAPWTSTGYHQNGTRFDRPGRGTIVFARGPDGRWLVVHCHTSLNPGVPRESYAQRPVKE